MKEGDIVHTFEEGDFATAEQRRALKKLIVEQLGIREKGAKDD